MLNPDMMEKLKTLAKDALGGKEGDIVLLIIESPKGKASSPEEAMDYAKEVVGDEEEMDVPDVYKEDKSEESSESGDPEAPLHSAVSGLIEQWDPQTPEGEKYLADLQKVYDENNHGMKKEGGY